jgi:beta-N-acetylhexosaminidase
MLRDVGFNVDLAPVLDVGRPGSAIESEGRSFGGDPKLVSRCGGAFAAALAHGGVAPTAKHFPGLGAAAVNTDDAVQRIDLSARELRHVDERPYRRFARGGGAGRLVMLSSAVYEAFSERPAALTRALATAELRDRLGFRGVSITDALETASTAAFGGPTKAALRAARAGTDLLLFTSADAAAHAGRALRRLLRRPGSRRRFAASVERVLDLRARVGG